MAQNRHRSNRYGNHHMEIERNTLGGEKIGIAYPPDEIFKYRGIRVNPSGAILTHQGAMYIPDHAEYREGEGSFVYYRGINGLPAPAFPSKCVAPPEAIYALNPVKRGVMTVIGFISSIRPRDVLHPSSLVNKALGRFVDFAHLTLWPFYLKDGYYAEPMREAQKLVRNMLSLWGIEEEIAARLGEIVGVMMEYDNAYRLRFQDVMSEAHKDALISDFPKEVKRLWMIMCERDKNPQVGEKTKGIVRLISLAWYVPSIKKAVRGALKEMDLVAMRLGPDDVYHAILYGDYNAQGKTFEERLQLYRAIHGEDETKWPPRIVVEQK